MWIKNDNEATQSLYTEDITDEEDEPLMDSPVEFNSNGTANISEELAEALVERYDEIRHYDADDDE